MKITIEINMDNDAFHDEWNGASELGRILAKIPQDVANSTWRGTCRDWNGNKVGKYDVTFDENE